MTGAMVNAEWALALGFLSEVVAEDTLDARIDEIAGMLLKNAPQGLGKAKQLAFDVSQGEINDTMIENTVKLIADVRDSDEGREGLSAFLEKRAPNW